jgi:hypothetical protein
MAAVIRGGRDHDARHDHHGGEIHDHGSGALAHLVDAGRLRPIVSQVLPLTEARPLHAGSRRRLHRHRSRRPRGSCFSTRLAGTLPGLAGQRIRWMLPELDRTCRTPSAASCGGGGRGAYRPIGALTDQRNLRWLVPAGLTAAGVGTGLTASYLPTRIGTSSGVMLGLAISIGGLVNLRSRRPRRRDQPAPCHRAGRLPRGRPGAGPRKPQGNGKLRSLAFRVGGIEGDRSAGNVSGGIW